MKFHEKAATPHAVYRLFDRDANLLYVGLSANPLGRLANHASGQQWRFEVAGVHLVWFDNWIDAAREEQRLIREEKPRHNKASFDPKRCGAAHGLHQRRARRTDGLCPKCGINPRDGKNGYCLMCRKKDMHERYEARKLKAREERQPAPLTRLPGTG